MKVFLDANILISVFNKEYPVFTYSARVLSLAENPKVQLYTSPISLAIAFYFAEKKSGAAKARQKIELLSSRIGITPIDKNIVMNVFKNKSINDFEDGLEDHAALDSTCKCIITEDLNDFHFSSIEVLDSKAFLEKYAVKQ